MADVELDPVPEPAEEQWELSEPYAVCTVAGGGDGDFRRHLQSAREKTKGLWLDTAEVTPIIARE
jgi:hypothetical protein